MLDSDLSSSLRNSRRYSRRSTPAVLTVLSVVVAASSITPATANPIPFLDFLYPTFHISTSKHSCSSSTSPTSTSKSSRSSANPQSPATGAGAAIVAEQEQYGLLQRRQSEYSKPKLRKRATSKGRKVPVKYESSDDGWSPADIWTLHGRRNPTDGTVQPTDQSNSPTGPDGLPVQNLDTTGTGTDTVANNDPSGSAIVGAADDGLDLPVGWQNGTTARHESYDPVIVAVFAVILVMCILGTIGLCRWRARKLRKLRDLERMEKEADEESTTSSINEKELKKRKKTTASSSAIRKRFTRFRRRRKRNATSGELEKTSDEEDDDVNRPGDGGHREDSSSVARSSITSTVMDDGADNTTQTPDEVPTNPQIATHPEELPPPPPSPLALPPAYPAGTSRGMGTRPNAAAEVAGQPEKAPVRGLEAEYDERDIALYTPSATRRPSRTRVRFIDEPTSDRPEVELQDEDVPRFESLSEPGSSLGPSRVAAGATRRAHVATDDKGLLERLRGLADEPTLATPSAPSAPPGDDLAAPLAPSFDELDEWDAARQLALVDAHAEPTSEATEEVTPLTTSNGFPALPPMPTSVIGSTDVTSYGLGAVWTGLNSTTSRIPSAPPMDAPGLTPSAPPPAEDVVAVPSAPPAWDDDDDDEIEEAPASNEQDERPRAVLSSTSSPLGSSDSSDPSAGESTQSTDADGSDSPLGTVPEGGIPRWSDTFRTRAQERTGLPRYEP